MPRFTEIKHINTDNAISSFYEAVDTTVWNNLSSNAFGLVPLDAGKQDQARLVSIKSFYSNFLYHRIIDIIADFILSAEFTFSVTPGENSGKALEVINNFWNEAPNNISRHLRAWIEELLVTGEMLWIFEPNPSDGRLYIQPVGSTGISDVAKSSSNHRNIAEVSVRFEEQTGEKTYKNLTYDRASKSMKGDAYYFRIGQTGDMLRGVPYLTHSLNILNELEAFVFSMLRGAMYKNSVWFDVTLEGKTEAEVGETAKRTGKKPPQPNSVIFHNERVKWEALNAGGAGSAGDINRQVDFFLNVALASSGISRSIFEGAPDRNSTESTNSGFKAIASIQSYLAEAFCRILEFALTSAANKSTIGKRNYKVACTSTPIGVRDIQRSSSSVARILSALGDAKNNLILTDEQIAELMPDVLDLLKTK